MYLLLTSLLEDTRYHFSRQEKQSLKVKHLDLEQHKIYPQELLIQTDTSKQICEGIEAEHDLKGCFDRMAYFLIDDILRGDINFNSCLEYEVHIKK